MPLGAGAGARGTGAFPGRSWTVGPDLVLSVAEGLERWKQALVEGPVFREFQSSWRLLCSDSGLVSQAPAHCSDSSKIASLGTGVEANLFDLV